MNKRTRLYSEEVLAGRLTEATEKQLTKFNKKYFNGTKTNSELVRILVDFALKQVALSPNIVILTEIVTVLPSEGRIVGGKK